MSSLESETKSGIRAETKNNTSRKEETKNIDMKKVSFYNPELLSKRKVIINTSTSKQMYSFPTSKRFSDNIKDDSPFFYNIPSTITKRSTSMGYGKKLLISEGNENPGPGAYNQLLRINNKGRYAISDLANSPQNKFGSEVRFRNQTIVSDTPAPNAYHPESMTKGNGIIYNSRYQTNLGKSMGQRLAKIGENIITPGPGSYKHMNINQYGKYPSSILSNSIQNKFGREIRFKPVKENGTPAPNAYKPECSIKGNGIMYNSRYGTNLGKTMGWKLNNLSQSVTPGPGAYEFFSDFEGFYKYGKNKNKKGKNEDEDDEDNDKNDEEEGSKSGNGNKKTKGGKGKSNQGKNGKTSEEEFGKDVE